MSFTATFGTHGFPWTLSPVISCLGDDDSPPVLAEVLDRSATGELRLRLLSGRPDSHPVFPTRRLPTAV